MKNMKKRKTGENHVKKREKKGGIFIPLANGQEKREETKPLTRRKPKQKRRTSKKKKREEKKRRKTGGKQWETGKRFEKRRE